MVCVFIPCPSIHQPSGRAYELRVIIVRVEDRTERPVFHSPNRGQVVYCWTQVYSAMPDLRLLASPAAYLPASHSMLPVTCHTRAPILWMQLLSSGKQICGPISLISGPETLRVRMQQACSQSASCVMQSVNFALNFTALFSAH